MFKPGAAGFTVPTPENKSLHTPITRKLSHRAAVPSDAAAVELGLAVTLR